MRHARIVRIEWDDRDLEPTDDLIEDAIDTFLGPIDRYKVSGEPSFEVKEEK